jgi:hypothetical protein
MTFSILDLANNPTVQIIKQISDSASAGKMLFDLINATPEPHKHQNIEPEMVAPSQISKNPVIPTTKTTKSSDEENAKFFIDKLKSKSTQELEDMVSGKTLARLGLPNIFSDPKHPRRSKRKLKRAPYYPKESDSVHGVLSAIATEGTFERQAALSELERRRAAEQEAIRQHEQALARARFGEQVGFELSPFKGIPHRQPDPSKVPAMLFQGLQSGLISGEDYKRVVESFGAEQGRLLESARDRESVEENKRVEFEREFRRRLDLDKLNKDKYEIQIRAKELGLSEKEHELELRKFAELRRKEYLASGSSNLAADFLANTETFSSPNSFMRDKTYLAVKEAVSLIGDSKASFDETLQSVEKISTRLKDRDSLPEETVEMLEQTLDSLSRRLGSAAGSNFGSAWNLMQMRANPSVLLEGRLSPEQLKRVSPFFSEGFQTKITQPNQVDPTSTPPGLFEGTALDTLFKQIRTAGSELKREISMSPSEVSRDLRTRLGSLPRNSKQFESLYGMTAPPGYDTMSPEEQSKAARIRFSEYIKTGE